MQFSTSSSDAILVAAPRTRMSVLNHIWKLGTMEKDTILAWTVVPSQQFTWNTSWSRLIARWVLITLSMVWDLKRNISIQQPRGVRVGVIMINRPFVNTSKPPSPTSKILLRLGSIYRSTTRKELFFSYTVTFTGPFAFFIVLMSYQ